MQNIHSENHPDSLLAKALVADYLDSAGLHAALHVFQAETGIAGPRIDLDNYLHHPTSESSQSFEVSSTLQHHGSRIASRMSEKSINEILRSELRAGEDDARDTKYPIPPLPLTDHMLPDPRHFHGVLPREVVMEDLGLNEYLHQQIPPRASGDRKDNFPTLGADTVGLSGTAYTREELLSGWKRNTIKPDALQNMKQWQNGSIGATKEEFQQNLRARHFPLPIIFPLLSMCRDMKEKKSLLSLTRALKREYIYTDADITSDNTKLLIDNSFNADSAERHRRHANSTPFPCVDGVPEKIKRYTASHTMQDKKAAVLSHSDQLCNDPPKLDNLSLGDSSRAFAPSRSGIPSSPSSTSSDSSQKPGRTVLGPSSPSVFYSIEEHNILKETPKSDNPIVLDTRSSPQILSQPLREAIAVPSFNQNGDKDVDEDHHKQLPFAKSAKKNAYGVRNTVHIGPELTFFN